MPEYQNRTPQMSDREIERNYSKLDIKLAEPNRVNCYTCKNGHITKTIDIHEGVTPMFNICDICKGESSSSGYKDIAPEIEVTHEWFVPTLAETKKYRKNFGILDHIFSGGLDYHKIK